MLSTPSALLASVRRVATWPGSPVCSIVPELQPGCLTVALQPDCHLSTSKFHGGGSEAPFTGGGFKGLKGFKGGAKGGAKGEGGEGGLEGAKGHFRS